MQVQTDGSLLSNVLFYSPPASHAAPPTPPTPFFGYGGKYAADVCVLSGWLAVPKTHQAKQGWGGGVGGAAIS